VADDHEATGAAAATVAQRLAGRTLLLTGVTGFVGEALLERILSDLPETRVLAVIRPGGGRSAAERLGDLVRKPAFGPLRDRLGGQEALDEVVAERVRCLEGDLAAMPAVPADTDVVIHCAGAVSFDPPLHEGFATNVLGTRELLRAVHAGGARPHLVHVSTAYVAGLRTGVTSEGPLEHAVDWSAEVAAAERIAARIEDDSRTPEHLDGFLAEARREHGGEGPLAVARDAERRRADDVRRRLVEAGRTRAQGLGWTDCYTFTKALGERLVETCREGLPLSIVRPSIIESALERPYPGWIEGFKMAEPLLLAYGRGVLPEFPSVPDGAIDIVPVDLVVNAILAVAATPPPAQTPAYFHVGSSFRNPLRFRELYRIAHEYFSAHPLPQRFSGADYGTFAVPTWDFPGAAAVERRLRLGERAVDLADRAVGLLPQSSRARAWAAKVDRQRDGLRFLRRYGDLYRPYTSATLVFADDNVRALTEGLAPEDRERWGVDPGVIDWQYYLGDVHIPMVTGLLRGRRERKRPAAMSTLPRGSGDPAGTVLAVFDLDGTVLSSTVVEAYLWLRLGGESAAVTRGRHVADTVRRLPGYLRADAGDRGALLRSVYRRYEGLAFADLEAAMTEAVTPVVLERVNAAALRRVREHRAAGHRTVLVTGAVELLTRPLAPLFDEVVAARLELDAAGRCTGQLAEPPVVAEARAAWLRRYARDHGADLAAAYGYADSVSDLPMLEAVGHPVAVSPDVPLLREARQRRWPVVEWARTPGTPGLRLPAPLEGAR
jgi:alcohol-forming fatty acyl-CoA reductase